ncbi:hypothetical protein ATO6_03070 [Oceanicola sp. 22II-s10i]|uniref:LysR family transcriptional regulator n=1 Tax=Oceanicola sp. 22II-s10i TaxID=1317116 RepID=UPI000B5261A1|nr:LysR family transcriptional regulator [Oceanicola sp. 22II-s10i]OWU85885.1 hypothetical protein ATO6_03070 [Oceanicola sp. 22II-s10i]
MRHLNLNALRIFSVVARHRTLGDAAEELNLTRGAVSQRIRQLELDLGVVLLERGARGVSLTPEGERCRIAVDQALGDLETYLSGLGDSGGQVTLHLGSSTASKWLMPRMAAFAERFPGVSLRTEVHSRRMSRDLGRNEIAIWPGGVSGPWPFRTAVPLTDIRLVAVCSPDFPRPDWAMGPDTLLTLPLLQDAHRRWERLIRDTGHTGPHALLNFDRSALALDAAIGGHGVAIVPRYMVEADVAANRLTEVWVDPAPPQDQLFVSWSEDHTGQGTVRRIVDWLRGEFGRHTA